MVVQSEEWGESTEKVSLTKCNVKACGNSLWTRLRPLRLNATTEPSRADDNHKAGSIERFGQVHCPDKLYCKAVHDCVSAVL